MVILKLNYCLLVAAAPQDSPHYEQPKPHLVTFDLQYDHILTWSGLSSQQPRETR